MKTKKQILIMASVCLILHFFCPIKFNLIIGENNKQQKEDDLPSSVKQSAASTNVTSSNDLTILSEQEKKVEPEKITISKPYRLTSFYSNDGYGTGSCTGSGLCEKDFQINSNGWYTYNGYLILAGATKECLNSRSGACGKWNTPMENKYYFSYYEKIVIKIDGVEYNGIILDSCGASMYLKEDRLDLFVSNRNNTIDRGYKGNNPITVFFEQ